MLQTTISFEVTSQYALERTENKLVPKPTGKNLNIKRNSN